jgi:arginase
VGGARELEATFERLAVSAREVYLHVDLDALDPGEAQANAFAAPGGLSLGEMETAIRGVRQRFSVRAAALTAYDPAADPSGHACRAGLSLLQAIVEEKR